MKTTTAVNDKWWGCAIIPFKKKKKKKQNYYDKEIVKKFKINFNFLLKEKNCIAKPTNCQVIGFDFSVHT